MASIFKHPRSRYWYARFLGPDKKYHSRSTKSTKEGEARKLAEQYEVPSRKLLTEAQARTIISDMYQIVHAVPLKSATVEAFCADWLAVKKKTLAAQSYLRYQDVVDKFLTFLGSEKKEMQIAAITAADITAFRDGLMERLSITSANIITKIVKVIFGDAKREGLVLENVADRVRSVRDREVRPKRRAFTDEEFRKLLNASEGEWKGLLIFGLFTGQRLKDLASLRWSNVDLLRNEIRLSTSKTNRQQILPMHPALRKHVNSISKGVVPGAPVFPKASGIITKFGRSALLSAQFYAIMVKAGLATERKHTNTKQGGSVKRTVGEISFHSLRHTATSLMKNAGMASAVVQDVIGHASAAMNAHYTHIDGTAKRTALESIPDLTQPLVVAAAAAKSKGKRKS